MSRINRLIVAAVLAVALCSIAASFLTASQTQEGNRLNGCGCYVCGDLAREASRRGENLPFNYLLFEDKACAGILAEDACPRELAKLPPEKRESFCRKLKDGLKFTSFKDSCPILAASCETEDKNPPKKPCENPPTEADPPPWFDDGSCQTGSQSAGPWVGTQIVDEQNRPLPRGQVWCVAKYSICRTSYRDSPNLIQVIKKVTVDAAAWQSNSEEARAACQSFIDEHKNAPQRNICCDTWEQASNKPPPPGSCNPISDPDCDGIPNHQDPFPLHPHSTEYTSYSPLTNFPFWKDFKNAVPHESCECQWELIDARYTCSDVRVQNSAERGSSNQAKYDYQAKWKCPATGRQVITTRQVTMPGLFCPRSRPNS